MSEKLRHQPEQFEVQSTAESAPSAEIHISRPEQSKHHHQENLEHIRQQIEKEAKRTNDLKTKEHESHKPSQAFINKELKEMAYSRTLNRVRRQLSGPNRALSHLIHQPVVNAISDATAKTIGRPSGIIGGGLLAALGTGIYYYIAKHYGYDYNYFVFLLLLSTGFVAGWIGELFLQMIKPASK